MIQFFFRIQEYFVQDTVLLTFTNFKKGDNVFFNLTAKFKKNIILFFVNILVTSTGNYPFPIFLMSSF